MLTWSSFSCVRQAAMPLHCLVSCQHWRTHVGTPVTLITERSLTSAFIRSGRIDLAAWIHNDVVVLTFRYTLLLSCCGWSACQMTAFSLTYFITHLVVVSVTMDQIWHFIVRWSSSSIGCFLWCERFFVSSVCLTLACNEFCMHGEPHHHAMHGANSN
jgi:hypothetical protein